MAFIATLVNGTVVKALRAIVKVPGSRPGSGA